MQKLFLFLVSAAVAFSAYAQPRGLKQQADEFNRNSAVAAAETDDEWITLGNGTMTEFILSSVYGFNPQVLNVEIQQNKNDENLYRIPAPFASVNYPGATGYLYNSAKATPMVIHVKDGYAWFDEFDTGMYLNTKLGEVNLVGEITVKCQAEGLLAQNTWQEIVDEVPDCLMPFQDGIMRMTTKCNINGKPYSNILYMIGKEGPFEGNMDGSMRITFPDFNPGGDTWKSIGKGIYTDDLAIILYPTEDQYNQTYEVEMEQNIEDPTMYRIVNPYAAWRLPDPEVTYDSSKDYYMIIYTLPEKGLATFADFNTGISLLGYGALMVTADAYYTAFEEGFGLTSVAETFPQMFGTYKDGVMTYAAEYRYGQAIVPTIFGWFTKDPNEPYYLNTGGKFKLVFPEATGVEQVTIANDDKEEYFNLQGVRVINPEKGQVVIVRKGGKSQKVIF